MPSIISDKMKSRSNSPRSLPVSGHLRSGTQVLIRAAENLKQAQMLYQKAATGQISFKDAEKQILDVNPNTRKAFTPRNTRHFNVYAHETEGGQASVDNIMERFSEVLEGDPEPRLYRVPVVFPPTPDGVEGFFKSEYSTSVGAIKYRSEYGDDGIRRCVYLKPIDLKEQAQRKKFLRRDPSIRKDCEPSSCAEFGAGSCKFRGRLHFHIPNVIGSGLFVFETGSMNASEDIFLRLEELYRSMNGNLPMFDHKGNPVFFLSKERKKVVYFEGGEEKSSLQWVPVLQTSLIKSNILLIEEKRRLQLAAPAPVPMSKLAPSAWMGASFGEEMPDESLVETVLDDDGYSSEGYGNAHGVNERQAELDVSKKPLIPAVVGSENAVTKAAIETPEQALKALLTMADEHSLAIHEYGQAKYGKDWEDSGALVIALYKDVMGLIERFGNINVLREFLPLMTILSQNEIPVTLAIPYFRKLFSEFKRKQVPEAIRHVQDLLKSGPEVTIEHMKSQLPKAADQGSL